ncbi:AraC family transcriptional activator of pobA [Chitinophaga sp. W2I13]|uniref:helix-turn-helix domain-containing protein n=1 Tax=Chitinophaga sp. W2I13 TaxID=3373923 RepID=UPI003D1F4CA1
MKNIPVHKLQDSTSRGYLLKPFTNKGTDDKPPAQPGAHRDDHYIFFIMLKGAGTAVVDFEEKTVRANQLYYILPEQIHYRIKADKANGWFIAADPSLIDPACRHAFDSWSGFQEPVTLSRSDAHHYNQLLSILYSKMTDQPPGSLTVLHSLLRSFFEMAADTVRVSGDAGTGSSRPAYLSLKFKKLLGEHIRQHKSPSDYADMLHISEPYLNECLKKITGSPVSFWIKYRIIIEAKRLLYFSDLNVKQIADDLGFENHSYFSRFFSKETGMTALTFRKKLKDPS